MSDPQQEQRAREGIEKLRRNLAVIHPTNRRPGLVRLVKLTVEDMEAIISAFTAKGA